MKYLALLILWSSMASAEDRPACTFDAVTRECAVLREQDTTQYVYFSKDTWIRNPLYDDTLLSFVWRTNYKPTADDVSDSRILRIDELAEFARASILSGILKGRSVESLSPAERSQYDRVRTVGFDLFGSLDEERIPCVTSDPNAFYDPPSHKLVMCLSAMVLPDEALLFVIAHEMAHAMDPCVMSFDLYHADIDPPPEPLKSENGPNQTVSRDLLRRQDTDLSALLATGTIQRLAPATGREDFPQIAQLQCFQKQGVGEPIPEEKAHRLARKIVRLVQKEELDIEDVAAAIRRRPYCFHTPVTGNTMGIGNPMLETFADMWGARVIADYWKSNPPMNDMQRFAPFALFTSRVCGRDKNTKVPFDGVHLPSMDRINNVVLTNPDIQAVLGCAPVALTCDFSAPDPNPR